jgi:transcriptional regulator with XRE-family HTH domain
MTQRELGERLHIDPDWISHWESGDSLPNLISAIKLSVFLGVPVNKLFGNLTNKIREEIWHEVL